MRRTIQKQQKLVPIPVEHPHAAELAEMSGILDACSQITSLIHADLIAGHIDPGKGREGMTAEQVIRAVIIEQMNGYSYAELSFHIVDSDCYRSFCRIGYDQSFNRNTLQRNFKKLRPETLEAINVLLIEEAKLRGVERGLTVRTDCTVEETNIHEPSDSTLLFDVVRVLARLMEKGRSVGYDIEFVNHTRAAKKRMLEIRYAKNNYESSPGHGAGDDSSPVFVLPLRGRRAGALDAGAMLRRGRGGAAC